MSGPTAEHPVLASAIWRHPEILGAPTSLPLPVDVGQVTPRAYFQSRLPPERDCWIRCLPISSTS